MTWGDSYGHRAGRSARDVAEAFYTGRSCKRTNCRTDGQHYYLWDNVIARRVPDEYLAQMLLNALEQGRILRKLEFRVPEGLPEKTVIRHFDALKLSVHTDKDWIGKGVWPSEHKNAFGTVFMSGEHVLPYDAWFVPADIPGFRKLNKVPPTFPRRSRTQFVNATLPLFP